jgi:protein TonB
MSTQQSARSAAASDEVNMEIDDTQALQVLSDTDQPALLVLSRDAALIETARKATPRGIPILHSDSIDTVAERLPSVKPGVLLVDASSVADLSAMLPQLTQHFPELVVIVASKREDGVTLMNLTAAGRIFRFLLTPLTNGQTRLAIEAAISQHLELKAAGLRMSNIAGPAGGGSGGKPVATYAAVAVCLLAALTGLWFVVKMFTTEPKGQPLPAVVQTSVLPDKPDPLRAEIDLAKQAFDQQHYLEPRGENALDLYRNALALDPQNAAAIAGIRSVVDKILERAEAALADEKLDDAVRNLDVARGIDPKYSRLAFLDTQLARERERLKLGQARDASVRMRAPATQADAWAERPVAQAPNNPRLSAPAPVAAAPPPAAPATAVAEAKPAAPPVAAAQEAMASTEHHPAEHQIVSPAAPPAAKPPPQVQAPQPLETLLQAGNLPRIREVSAAYPREAAIKDIEGWVDLEFMIGPDGIPKDIKVRTARPKRMFEEAAIASLKQWQFKPVIRNGEAVAAPAILRMMFRLK